ncbi:hypothetical protein [Hyphococcus sp.]|uniref:hypothetical protein n=1 Tax=Hyphococcus sp. TaxID=2038636 RepID=UPI0020810BEA|nr:MAG: hypothetical protein DHS20C04_00980 [Marinicaulis sp.]
MSAIEYSTLQVYFVEAAVAVLGLGFTMFSVYVTGLYFYLARATFGVRLTGFVVFSIGCALILLLSFVLYDVASSVLWCDACGVDGTQFALRKTLLIGGPVGLFLGAIIYIVLGIMTFSPKWRGDAFPRSME